MTPDQIRQIRERWKQEEKKVSITAPPTEKVLSSLDPADRVKKRIVPFEGWSHYTESGQEPLIVKYNGQVVISDVYSKACEYKRSIINEVRLSASPIMSNKGILLYAFDLFVKDKKFRLQQNRIGTEKAEFKLSDINIEFNAKKDFSIIIEPYRPSGTTLPWIGSLIKGTSIEIDLSLKK